MSTETTQPTASPRLIDPRAAKSRAALITAMIEHLDSTLTPPTVSEVVARAGASRPTFYQHFGDVPTLMHEAAMSRLDTAFAALPSEPVPAGGDWGEFAHVHFTQLFEHLIEHRDFYLAIVRGPSGLAALDRLIAFLAERMNTISPLRHSIRALAGDEQAPRLAQFLAAGLTSLAIDDLRANVPVERMVRTTTVFLDVATSAAHHK